MKFELLLLAIFAFASHSLLAAIEQERSADNEIPNLKPPSDRLEPIIVVKKNYALWIILACGVPALAAVLVFKMRPLPNPPQPAIERIRQKLQTMQGDADAQKIARLFREYVESVAGIPGRASTVDELIEGLSRFEKWTAKMDESVRCFMDPLELAKFAPQAPTLSPDHLVKSTFSLIAEIDEMARSPL